MSAVDVPGWNRRPAGFQEPAVILLSECCIEFSISGLLFLPQGNGGLDAQSVSRWHPRRDQSKQDDGSNHQGQNNRIMRRNSIDDAGQNCTGRDCQYQADHSA